MRDYLQELAIIEDFRQKHSLGSSLSRVEGEGLPVLFVEPIRLERWQDKPTDIVKCEPLDIEKHKAMNVNDLLSDPIIRGKDYEEGLPRLAYNHPESREPISFALYVLLGAFGEGKPAFWKIRDLLAFRLIEETHSQADSAEIAQGITLETFNDYADLLTTIEASHPTYGNQKDYKTLIEATLDRIERATQYINQRGAQKMEEFKKENGVEFSKFPMKDENEINEFLKSNPLAQVVAYKAITLGYYLSNLGATIEGYNDETAHLKEELALLDKQDGKAQGRGLIYSKLTEKRESHPRERQPIARASDFNAPSNNVFSDLSKLFPLFRHIVTKDSEGNPKSLSQADQDLITRAKAYEQALNNRKDNIADIKAKIKAKKAEIDQEKNNPYPDAIKVSQLQAELDTLTASRKAVNDELKELSTNILPYNGEYYTNTNTLPTRINDNGEVELSIAGIDSNTTITMPPYVAVGESGGDAGTAKDIQRQILIKVRSSKDLAVYFSNEEIYQIMLGEVGSRVANLAVRNNSKQDFLRYVDYLQKTFIVNTKVKTSEKDKGKAKKESPTIKGAFLSYSASDYKGVSIKLNEGLFLWAIMGNTSYTSIAKEIVNLDNHSYRNALSYFYNQEAQNGASIARNYTYSAFFENNPDFTDPTKVDPSHKAREIKKVGKMLVDLKEQGFLAQENHGATGFNFLTSKGANDAKAKAKAKPKTPKKP
jgi:hypothetical protein